MRAVRRDSILILAASKTSKVILLSIASHIFAARSSHSSFYRNEKENKITHKWQENRNAMKSTTPIKKWMTPCKLQFTKNVKTKYEKVSELHLIEQKIMLPIFKIVSVAWIRGSLKIMAFFPKHMIANLEWRNISCS